MAQENFTELAKQGLDWISTFTSKYYVLIFLAFFIFLWIIEENKLYKKALRKLKGRNSR